MNYYWMEMGREEEGCLDGLPHKPGMAVQGLAVLRTGLDMLGLGSLA